MTWRVKQPCGDCPFTNSPAGVHLRRTLGPSRWHKITDGLRRGEWFICHETTEETGDGSNLTCAGAIAWQSRRGLSSQYVRLMQRVEWFFRQGWRK